jgi:hypothetical protein
MNPRNRKWSPQKVEELRFLVRQKKSWKEIMKIFDIGRNQLSGLTYRYCRDITQPEKQIVVKNETKQRISKSRQHGPLSINFSKKYAELPPELIINYNPVPFPPGSGRCLSMIGDVKNLKCCGLPAIGSWCEEHRKKYYVSPKKQ